jgi:hypothetical protein
MRITDQSSRNYFLIFYRFNAYFSKMSKSSPRIRYMMKRVTPTYQTMNIMPYIQILALTPRGFNCG